MLPVVLRAKASAQGERGAARCGVARGAAHSLPPYTHSHTARRGPEPNVRVAVMKGAERRGLRRRTTDFYYCNRRPYSTHVPPCHDPAEGDDFLSRTEEVCRYKFCFIYIFFFLRKWFITN